MWKLSCEVQRKLALKPNILDSTLAEYPTTLADGAVLEVGAYRVIMITPLDAPVTWLLSNHRKLSPGTLDQT